MTELTALSENENKNLHSAALSALLCILFCPCPGKYCQAEARPIGPQQIDLPHVSNDAKISTLENRCFGIVVDRHCKLRFLHSGATGNHCGDAAGHIESKVSNLIFQIANRPQ